MDKEEFELRMVLPEDKDEIERLTRNLVKEKEKNEPFDEKRFDWGIMRRIFDPLQRHGTFVAVDKKTRNLAGMIFSELRVDPFGTSEAYIKQIHVDKEYRGRSLGKRLLTMALESLRKSNIRLVKVNLPQDPALHDKINDEFEFDEFKFRPTYTVMELKFED
ncbi:MAG: GNAT family N-acetyltransferase [Candidatus Lokiarchaeota archaeon]|nr:GNAT family N-acetyltransferase [Candidatus Lokiarchaeota archaeon]